MTKYRIKRRGVEEYLAEDATPTKDPAMAMSFEYYTSAVIFMLENLDAFDLWTVQPFHVDEPSEVAA